MYYWKNLLSGVVKMLRIIGVFLLEFLYWIFFLFVNFKILVIIKFYWSVNCCDNVVKNIFLIVVLCL